MKANHKRIGTAALLLSTVVTASTSFAGYAFVWANQPSSASYTPAPSYQHNSSGYSNTIQRSGPGLYRVYMPLVMAPFHGGNVQVSAYGSGSNYCKVRGWYRHANVDLNIDVSCYTASGQLADTRFTALYHDTELSGDGRAFAWANEPTPTTYGYDPHGYYRFNAGPPDPGGHLWIHREGLGRYLVLIHGWASPERTFLVTAYGGGAERCNVRDNFHEEAYVRTGRYWIRRQALRVHCYQPSGAPADAQFTLAYSQNRVLGGSRTLGAYLFADRPSTSSYFSRAEHDFNPLDWGSGQIRRIGTGRYEVDLFQLAGAYSRSTAIVTAQSNTADQCKVRRWGPRGSIVQVSVDCYDAGGAPKDVQFFLSFVTDRTF